jgi:GxxExxY protein
MEHSELTEKIIGAAMKVHRTLGPGFLESIYQKALAHELHKLGLRVECEKPIKVIYDSVEVGHFSGDLLNPAHEVQLVNYLTATNIEIGLLLNFGAERLEFKRKYRTYREKQAAES